ncbi:ABC transporter ATP-binding protein [Acutalibacter muris]|jgi:ATP-binding cassette subfamily B protein|uniref:ABC transporter ATP-binding protein n=1 Tax=Acutalibacter muris TaxID=1796620 RepID=A0A1Z2XNQ2_9FIRM|nr:ABC transporter ATP-binding protein [Acutalibacter muris]ANU53254.1 ABC transporter ATP-binding protein [Hungateiclostridiaceae bacterium KB18]ASB40072.1 ABC transporter ATP-binding protein [Acutalibacter muris]MCI9542745.1 ABC transporter ATP-binding protein [Acutalibacter muris]QQR29362.1 ABC transporter ATP-binding protein [Acutalibacter muris]
MREYLPVLIVGGIIGMFALVFLIAYLVARRKNVLENRERNMPDSEIIRRLLAYAKPYKWQFVLVFFVMLLSIGYEVISPLLVGHIEETVVGDFEMSYLLTVVGGYVGILLVSLVCTYIQAMVLQKVGQKILSAMREDVFTHIESLSHAQLNDIPVGKLVTRVSNDPNAISFMFTNIIVTLAKNVMVIFGVLAAMLMLNYMLTLMVLCFVPFVVLFTIIFRKFSRSVHLRVNDATTDLNTYLSENLSGIKITQIFNQEQRKMSDFLQRSRTLQRAKRSRMFVFGIFQPMVYMLYISSVLCLLYLGGKGYIGNWTVFGQTVSSGIIVSFYMYISKFFNPIQQLAEQFDMLQRSFAAAEKIFTVMDMVPEVVDTPNARELTDIKGEIEFKDVWFAYNPGEWVLKGVSFHISPRQTVAFVGSTGSGKSTILSLICRNYDIQKGQILIDGVDIKDIKIASLRKHFGQMLQDVFLFSGSIRSNIVLREEFPEEDVKKACEYVNADKFIYRLDNGLDEVVRERGNNFSAGQRQLLSFARTLLHKPAVMILDEATANIDTETELLIQDSLEKMKNIGTMLIVAHRLSTIQHADNIILLSHGEILEQGTHQELLKQKGRYYNLYTLQYNKEQLQRA